jgi:hypothetical protein
VPGIAAVLSGSVAAEPTLVCRSYTTTVFVSSTRASLRLLLLRSRHLQQPHALLS